MVILQSHPRKDAFDIYFDYMGHSRQEVLRETYEV